MSTQPPRSAITQKVGASWFTLFTVAWLVIWTVQLTPLQLLLPLQLDTSDSAVSYTHLDVYKRQGSRAESRYRAR